MPFARSGRPGLLGTVSRTAAISCTPQVTATAGTRRAIRREPESAAPGSRTPPVPPTLPPPAAGAELADQLSRLADLRSAGLLTDDEFAAAKARLLM